MIQLSYLWVRAVIVSDSQGMKPQQMKLRHSRVAV